MSGAAPLQPSPLNLQPRLALVQMHCPKGDVAGNLAAIEGHLRDGDARGVDILCFPEMSITGYIDGSVPGSV